MSEAPPVDRHEYERSVVAGIVGALHRILVAKKPSYPRAVAASFAAGSYRIKASAGKWTLVGGKAHAPSGGGRRPTRPFIEYGVSIAQDLVARLRYDRPDVGDVVAIIDALGRAADQAERGMIVGDMLLTPPAPDDPAWETIRAAAGRAAIESEARKEP